MARPKIHKQPRSVNLTIPLALRRELYRIAASRGRSMSNVVCEWIEREAGKPQESK